MTRVLPTDPNRIRYPRYRTCEHCGRNPYRIVVSETIAGRERMRGYCPSCFQSRCVSARFREDARLVHDFRGRIPEFERAAIAVAQFLSNAFNRTEEVTMTKTTHRESVELTHSAETDSIVLGYRIGSAELPHGRTLQVDASGSLIRFSIDGLPGYVDVRIGSLAHRAAVLLTENVRPEDGPNRPDWIYAEDAN